MGSDGRSSNQEVAAQGRAKVETAAQPVSSTTARKLDLPWGPMPAPPLSHCGTWSRRSTFLPPYNGCRQNTWHGSWVTARPQWMLTVISYYRLPKRTRDGFTRDQTLHMCFSCAPF